MKKKVLFLILFLAWTLSAKELLVLSFDASRSVLQKRLPVLEQKLSSFTQNENLSIERFGDRYAIVLPLNSQVQKEKILLALGSEYKHIFSIELPDKKQRPKAVTQAPGQSTLWNLWEWVAMILLSIVLVVIFAKGVRDMMRVRRSQRLMRHQQLEIEKELKKEM